MQWEGGVAMAVYFIRNSAGHIKIGYSDDPNKRKAGFQTGNSLPLKILACMPGNRDDEQALHERFAECRMSGEWFYPHERLLGFIDAVAHSEQQENASAVRAPTVQTLVTRARFALIRLSFWVVGLSQPRGND